MAEQHSPTEQQATERELRIGLDPIWSQVKFEGTMAQLEAEGVIPEGFEWPRAADDRRWEANGFTYWLRRTRPEGHKGPMRSWLEMDNWFIRVGVVGRDHFWRQHHLIERKAEELKAMLHRQSAAGSREWNIQWEAYWAAHTDDAFQRFLSGVLPERRKPGRKAKAANGDGAGHG